MCRAEQNQATGRRKFRPLRRSLAELLASGARFSSRLCSSQPWTIPSKPPASRASASADPFCSGTCGRGLGSRTSFVNGWRRVLCVRPRPGRVRRHPAPPLRLGLGPRLRVVRLRVVDAGLCHPGDRELVPASLLPDGLARGGTGKTWTVRTEATGAIPALMRFAGVTLPARVRAPSPPPEVAAPPPRTPPKRRGRPRRSARRA